MTQYYNGLSQELKDKMDSREFDMSDLSQLTTKQAQHDALRRLVRASAVASFKVLQEEEQMMKQNGGNQQRGQVHFTSTTGDTGGRDEHEHHPPQQNVPPPRREDTAEVMYQQHRPTSESLAESMMKRYSTQPQTSLVE